MRSSVFAIVCLLLLSACGPKEPIKIGFLGGVSGRSADLGTAGRNGAQLAIEWRNAAGGIQGRAIELLVRDDHQDGKTGQAAVAELSQAGVVLILGPMTSSVAVQAVPEAEKTGLVLIGGTVTTNSLSGKDDIFFRVVSSTSVYGKGMAEYQRKKLGLQRAAVLVDLSNPDYTLSWMGDYRKSFEQSGGKVVKVVEFDSRQDPHYTKLAAQLLSDKPDVISMVCNTLDAGMLVQKIRQQNQTVQVAGAGWTGTERLIELGGMSAEGMLIEQYFDRNDPSPQYRAFRDAYRQRFGQDPGYASVAGFDAASIALDVLSRTQDRAQIKKEILKTQTFSALQGRVEFDAFGDAMRPQFMSRIEQAHFKVLRD